MNQGVHSTHSIARWLPWAEGRLSSEPLTLSHGKRNIGTQLRNRSKLVKKMTPARNKGGMHVNGYLHKCLHHKIHPGKQHCKGAHTKKNIHISALPHADTPTPARAKLVWSQGPAETQERGSFPRWLRRLETTAVCQTEKNEAGVRWGPRIRTRWQCCSG